MVNSVEMGGEKSFIWGEEGRQRETGVEGAPPPSSESEQREERYFLREISQRERRGEKGAQVQ